VERVALARLRREGGEVREEAATEQKVGQYRDLQYCNEESWASKLDSNKCYKVSVSSGSPAHGTGAANLKVEWTTDGAETNDGLKAGEESFCRKKVTKLDVHCNEGRSVTYAVIECKCP
jgi:hypothetical protein